jgi:hypothetical protein
MSKIIQVKTNFDFTGSNGGNEIPCWRFDSEPTEEQQAFCSQNNISMEWTSGSTRKLSEVDIRSRENSSVRRNNSIPIAPVSTLEKYIYGYIVFLSLLALIVWLAIR